MNKQTNKKDTNKIKHELCSKTTSANNITLCLVEYKGINVISQQTLNTCNHHPGFNIQFLHNAALTTKSRYIYKLYTSSPHISGTCCTCTPIHFSDCFTYFSDVQYIFVFSLSTNDYFTFYLFIFM